MTPSTTNTPNPAAGWRSVLTLPADWTGDGPFAEEVIIDGAIIALFFHQSGWFAIDGMCAHQGGPLASGVVAGGCVTCPWHGWQYDLATGIQMINRQPLQTVYPVRRVGDEIQIQLPPLTTDEPQ